MNPGWIPVSRLYICMQGLFPCSSESCVNHEPDHARWSLTAAHLLPVAKLDLPGMTDGLIPIIPGPTKTNLAFFGSKKACFGIFRPVQLD